MGEVSELGAKAEQKIEDLEVTLVWQILHTPMRLPCAPLTRRMCARTMSSSSRYLLVILLALAVGLQLLQAATNSLLRVSWHHLADAAALRHVESRFVMKPQGAKLSGSIAAPI